MSSSARSSSPFSYRRTSSSYSSSSSTSSFLNTSGRFISWSDSSSSSFHGSTGGKSMMLNHSYGSRSPVGFSPSDDLLAEPFDCPRSTAGSDSISVTVRFRPMRCDFNILESILLLYLNSDLSLIFWGFF